ncbi:MAG: ABC transporter permease [Dermatophilus congolensis]|nr:ABC transporter permease [Dermatophilus congolensis]
MTSTAGSALISLTSIPDIVRLLVVVFGCAIFAGLLRKWTGLGNGRDEIWATARATVQLLVVGLIITAVLGSWWLTALFVTVMVAVAARTSSSRIGVKRQRERSWILLPIALGAIPITLLLVVVGLLPAHPVSVIPTAGILIGNAMTGTTLAGKQAFSAMRERKGEVEAALSIGLLEPESRLMVAQPAAQLALIPTVDTTRTVGLVTLPGAFVGTLLGGATPLEAAALQLVVLVGIIVAQSIAVPLVLQLIVRGHVTQRA